eukprot:2286711-Amphidinium_carterae.1
MRCNLQLSGFKEPQMHTLHVCNFKFARVLCERLLWCLGSNWSFNSRTVVPQLQSVCNFFIASLKHKLPHLPRYGKKKHLTLFTSLHKTSQQTGMGSESLMLVLRWFIRADGVACLGESA